MHEGYRGWFRDSIRGTAISAQNFLLSSFKGKELRFAAKIAFQRLRFACAWLAGFARFVEPFSCVRAVANSQCDSNEDPEFDRLNATAMGRPQRGLDESV